MRDQRTQERGRRAADTRSGATRVSAEELIELRREGARIRLAPPSVAAAPLAGPYLSTTRGRGMEFDEVRPYQPGDEIRNIDWHVTARTGRAHSKLFSEERERPVLIVLDMAESMHFGTRKRFKSVAAARAAAVIAWGAADAGDRVGGVVTNVGGGLFPPRRRRRHLHHLFTRFAQAVGTADSASGSDSPSKENAKTELSAVKQHTGGLADGLRRLRCLAEPGSKIFVISDFYETGDEIRRHLRALARFCDVTCIRVYDALEQAPPPAGCYRFADGRGAHCVVDASRAWRDAYAEQIDARRSRVEEMCRRYRMSLVELRADQEPAEALSFIAATGPRGNRRPRAHGRAA